MTEAFRPGLVDVVVATYNARDVVLDCLASLSDPSIAERIVVDDVSDDGTADAVRERFPDVKVENLDQHRGLAHALNAGAARGGAPFVLFLNNDLVAEPGSVARLVHGLVGDEAASSAGGRLIDFRTGATQDRYRPRDFPSLSTFVARLIGVERLFPRNRWSGGHLRTPLEDQAIVRIDQQPAGACILVRRDLLSRIGGWDEGFWFWYEDVDLSRRLADFGPALWVGPATFRHLGEHSTSSWPKSEQHRFLYHGTLLYSTRHLSRWESRVLAALVAAVCLPRLVLARILRRPSAEVYTALVREAAAVTRGGPARLTVPPAHSRRRAATTRSDPQRGL